MSQYVTAAIILKMTSLRESMTKSEQRVIDTIIDSPQMVIHSSIADLAKRSNVSDPTVIRACRKLGLEGYQDLKLTLARELVNPLQLINEDISSDDNTQSVVTKVFQGIIKTLEFTLQTVDFSEIEKALNLIIGADRVAIVGFGNSRSIALDMQHKFMRVGKAATAYSDPYLAAIAITYLKPNDVFFCVSHSGSSKDVVDLAQQARDKRVNVLSITNIGISPLSKISTIALHTSSNESNYRIIGLNSRLAQLAIIDSLHALLSLHYGKDELLQPEDAVKKFNY